MKRQRAIGLGIAGCGDAALALHGPALARVAGLRPVAVAETDLRRRRDAVRALGATRAFGEWRELLEDGEVEAVLVALPSSLHAEAAVKAFEAGRHVYLEKPLATDPADGRRVVEAWRRSGSVGAMGFNFRFHPVHRAVRAALAEGRIGEPAAVRTTFTAAPPAGPGWKRRRASGGGVLLDLGSHHVDLVRHLLGREVVAVRATTRSRVSEADTASVELRLDTGVLVGSLFAWGTADVDRVEIHGDRGRIDADRYAGTVTTPGRRHEYGRRARLTELLATTREGARRLLRPPGEPSYRAALAAFADEIRGGPRSCPTIDDGARSLAAIAAAERSAETGGWIDVERGPA